MLQGSQSDPLPEQTNCYKLLWTASAWTGAFDQVLLGWALMSRMCAACTRWWWRGHEQALALHFADFGNGREPWR